MNDIGVEDLISVIVRYRLIIMLVFLLFVTTSVVYNYFLATPIYRSSVVFFPGNISNTLFLNPASIKQIVLSDDFLSKAAKDVDLAGTEEETIQYLKDIIAVEPVKDTKFVQITVEDNNPARTKDILDKVYSLIARRIESSYQVQADIYRTQLSLTKVRLDEAEIQATYKKDFKDLLDRSAGITEMHELGRNGVLRFLSDAENRRIALQDRYWGLEKELNSIKSVEIIKSSSEPRSPIRPNKKMNIVVSGMLGLFVGVFLIFCMEYFRKRS